MRTIVSIAIIVSLVGCSGTTPNAKPILDAANNTAEQNKEIAHYLIRNEYSQWDDAQQFKCLDKLWQAESRWNHRARNKRTGACGIPQSYPCNKMSESGKTYGVDYRKNPLAANRLGLAIHRRAIWDSMRRLEALPTRGWLLASIYEGFPERGSGGPGNTFGRRATRAR